MAIATSSGAAAVEAKRAGHPALFARMAVVVNGEDPELRAGKPAPDIFLLACRRLSAAAQLEPRLEPAECVVFEDSGAGMDAGLAAGMRTVVVPDPLFTPAEVAEQFARATEVLKTMEAWDPAVALLPPYH